MSHLKSYLARIPGVAVTYRMLRAAIDARRSPFLAAYPPGTFYSPVPGIADIPPVVDVAREAIPGVELDEAAQLSLLHELRAFAADLPFRDGPVNGLRFHLDNEYYSYGDAIVLAAMLRHLRPKHVIEVGSGFSSAVMLDTRDGFLDPATQFTFIDPYPERLRSLLRPADARRCTIFTNKVQDVDLSAFGELQANDILFVDSSHVVKLGSDVAWILFEILPRLAPGVVVHFHDVPWPFEYPLSWARAGRAWNEAYFLRAFLEYNAAFRILFFNAFMATRHRDEMLEQMPLAMKPSRYALTVPASSLWLVKV